MSIPISMFSRQVQRSVTGSMRGPVCRVASSSRGQARFASSSSSSSSNSSRSSFRAAPVAIIASIAAAGSIFALSNKKPLASETVKRKEYWERMKVEEKQQPKEAEKQEAKSESPSRNESKEDTKEEVASEATSDLAEEASQESAFDPETNTINWDCPCLGGMAHGPCGEEFKTAFSCFVFSEAEPKGIDCVENFKGMQDCFRKHPEHYKDEIEDDEDFENQEASNGSLKDTVQSNEGDEDEDEGVREFRREMNKES